MTKKTRELKPLPADLENTDLGGLEQLHSDMLATCSDLGFTPTSLCLQTLHEGDLEGGLIIVRTLHQEITDFLGNPANKKSLAEGDAEEHKKEAPKSGATNPAKQKTPAQKMADQKAARLTRDAAKQQAAQPANQKESTVAKTAKKAKKTVAKKAKKAASKKGATSPRSSFDSKAKIIWIRTKEGNGAREGTAKHERRELLRKSSGKTVEAYLKAGGVGATLIHAVADKTVKIEKPAA